MKLILLKSFYVDLLWRILYDGRKWILRSLTIKNIIAKTP